MSKDEKKKGKFGAFLGKLVKGVGRVADNALLGGVITNLTHDIEGSPKGKFDWFRFVRVVVSCTIPVILLIMLWQGVITIEQLGELIEKLLP